MLECSMGFPCLIPTLGSPPLAVVALFAEINNSQSDGLKLRRG